MKVHQYYLYLVFAGYGVVEQSDFTVKADNSFREQTQKVILITQLLCLFF